ncbi:ANTAR domain-containing protein [Amycolatopsis sp. cmx-11-12]|uniref:ANTAR domain-containing protein n=1 Tax=Amycolatopsis sp. cmx-11-12 TaxID=2785795 RepID=UPI00391855E7
MIGQAKGLLAARCRITVDEAFRRLHRNNQHNLGVLAAHIAQESIPDHFDRSVMESGRKNHDALSRGTLTVPILGISSSHGSIPDMAVSLSPWAADTRGVVIPDAGHFIPDEQPGAVVEAVTAFIGHR